MTKPKRKARGVYAWAWLCDFGLCKWAMPSKHILVAEGKPSPEAKAVRVLMVKK